MTQIQTKEREGERERREIVSGTEILNERGMCVCELHLMETGNVRERETDRQTDRGREREKIVIEK